MKLLNTYQQVSALQHNSTSVRNYENAALKRRREIFQLPQDTKPETLLRPAEKLLVYKRPVRNLTFQPEPRAERQESQLHEPFSQKQIQQAIQQYRRISGFTGDLGSDLDKLVKGMLTGQAPELQGVYSEKVILEYKRRKEEMDKAREKELWSDFDVSHMLYIDADQVSAQIQKTSSGQILNYII